MPRQRLSLRGSGVARDNAGVSAILPVNLDDLLHCRGVESARVEFKSGWDPRTTGHQALETICAFANDYHNLNGGYVVLGVAEEHGRGVMPPAGLTAAEIAAAGKWIRGHCNRLDPPYQPIVSPEVVAGRRVLVLWAPASDTKPHSAPDGPRGAAKYWIRLGAETVDAQANGLLSQLMAQTARVPWDDRRAFDARIEDLRGDGAERIAAAPLRLRRGANVLSRDAARAPGARSGVVIRGPAPIQGGETCDQQQDGVFMVLCRPSVVCAGAISCGADS